MQGIPAFGFSTIPLGGRFNCFFFLTWVGGWRGLMIVYPSARPYFLFGALHNGLSSLHWIRQIGLRASFVYMS